MPEGTSCVLSSNSLDPKTLTNLSFIFPLDTHHSEQGRPGEARRANAGPRHPHLEHQSPHVQLRASRHVFDLTVVQSVRSGRPHSSAPGARACLPPRPTKRHRQARGKQNRECATICREYLNILLSARPFDRSTLLNINN